MSKVLWALYGALISSRIFQICEMIDGVNYLILNRLGLSYLIILKWNAPICWNALEFFGANAHFRNSDKLQPPIAIYPH